MTRRQSFGEVEREKILELSQLTLWSKEGENALAYLRNERCFSDEVIKSFNMGFVPMRVNHELRGRILTPFFDPYGKIVAFSSRHILDKRNFWHESFDKSFYLYGLHIAKKYIFQSKKAILVEGEFDVAYLHSRGIKMSVGVCGSAFNKFQAGLLARYCKEVYVVFDGDENRTGQRAINRVIKLHKNKLHGMNFIPVFLPEKKDPDDFIKEYGKNEFKLLLQESKKNTINF